MTDTLGALALPVPAPIARPLDERTLAPGDPALVTVGSFAATVLQAELGDAWAVLGAGARDRPGAVDGVRDGKGPVRRVFHADPRKGYFQADDLPGLFVCRTKIGKWSWVCLDCLRRTSQISVFWLPPPAEADPQRRERDPFVNAVYGALHKGFSLERHPAWVVDADKAVLDGLAPAFATSTSAQTISSFTGSLAGQTMVAARPIAITTSPATGAYNTADRIAVTGLLADGAAFTVRTRLTQTDGGETINTIFPFGSPVSVALPAMLTTTGTITIGYADSPDVRKGSLVQRVSGFSELYPLEAVYQPIRVPQPNADPRMFEALEFPLFIQEDLSPDMASRAFSPWDIEAHGTTTDGDEVFEFVIEG